MKQVKLATCLVLLVLSPNVLNAQASMKIDNAVGYPSVAAALADLKNKPGIQISVQRGWTIVEDTQEKTIWSFTPPDHPAKPAVIKRQIVSENAQIKMKMSALCEAEKIHCDALLAQFQALNRQTFRGPGNKKSELVSTFTPTRQQNQQAERTAILFFSAIDAENRQDAYEMFSPSLKNLMSYEKFSELENRYKTMFGGEADRFDRKSTWYKDPPCAKQKGIFATFDYQCTYRNANICKETLILHQGSDGIFRVMRHSRNMIDKATEKTLRARQKKLQRQN
jgi:hypothetical protein